MSSELAMRPRRISKMITVSFVTTVMLSLGVITDAHAYLDPGTGSLIWQALLAGFFGAMFYARSALRRVKDWRQGRKKIEVKGSSQPNEQEGAGNSGTSSM